MNKMCFFFKFFLAFLMGLGFLAHATSTSTKNTSSSASTVFAENTSSGASIVSAENTSSGSSASTLSATSSNTTSAPLSASKASSATSLSIFSAKNTPATTTKSEEQSPWPSWFSSSKKTSQKWAIFPSYSHNSTYGHSLGGRFFIYPAGNVGYYTSLEGTLNEDLFFSTKFSYQYWRKNGDNFNFTALYDGFTEPYYGEGYNTLPTDRQDIPIHKVILSIEYVANVIDYLYGGGFVNFHYRSEKNKAQPMFPEDTVFSGGVLVRYDSRDSYFNSTRGEFYELRSWLTSQFPTPLFLEGEMRFFFALLDNLTLALRGMGGLTFFNPSSYLFRFSLGGPDLLRGYRLNRFRGEKYYLSQTELRYGLLNFLSLVGFLDIGSAGDEFLSPPRFAFGVGVRFGLPPDNNKKIRLDLGFSEDNFRCLTKKGGLTCLVPTNFIIAFGHSF